MSNRVIEVTPEQLETTADSIENLAADYREQYKLLYDETKAMASTWSGKDNQAYISQIAGFEDDFEKMHGLMINYADFLRTSAKAYRTTQDTITTEARKLTN